MHTGRASSWSLLVLAGVVVNLAVAGLVLAVGLTDEELEGRPTDFVYWLGELALVAVLVLPALVALGSRRGRPLLLVAAALLCAFLAPLSAVLTLPLVLSAVLYAVVYGRARGGTRGGDALVAAGVVVAGVAALAPFLILTDGVCWEYERRADGTTVSRTVPTEGRWEERNGGGVGGGGAVGPLGGDVVEAGGGCEDRLSALGATVSLALVASAALGAGVPRRAAT
jgi:hypothetical protein